MNLMPWNAWLLALDVMSARALVWVGSWGQERELTAEAHSFFHDRYSRLAAYHREHGRLAKAARLQAEADETKVR